MLRDQMIAGTETRKGVFTAQMCELFTDTLAAVGVTADKLNESERAALASIEERFPGESALAAEVFNREYRIRRQDRYARGEVASLPLANFESVTTERGVKVLMLKPNSEAWAKIQAGIDAYKLSAERAPRAKAQMQTVTVSKKMTREQLLEALKSLKGVTIVEE